MSVGEIIKIARKRKNITQVELANQINKSSRIIQKYESGEITPSIDTLKEISEILGVEQEISEEVSSLFSCSKKDKSSSLIKEYNIVKVFYKSGGVDTLILDNINKDLINNLDCDCDERFIVIEGKDVEGLSTSQFDKAPKCELRVLNSSIERIKNYVIKY